MKNNHYANSQDYINRWVVSYSDFVTLLLALFVAMYSLSLAKTGKLEEFSSSVNEIFSSSNIGEKNISIKKLKERKHLIETFSSTKVKINSINIKSNKNITDELSSKIKSYQENELKRDFIEFNTIKQLIEEKVTSKEDISISQESRGLIIRLKNNLLFDPGSDIIKDKALITLDQIAGILRDIPNLLRIEGHTDNTPINTSKFPSNWELSTARATNIIKYLVNKHKFDPIKLSAVGYGEYMPLIHSSNKMDRSKNRRVDIAILNSSSKILEPNINK